jgi:hypothetical protein
MGEEKREAWGYGTSEDGDWEHADSREEAIEGAVEAVEANGSGEPWIIEGAFAEPENCVPDADLITEDMEQYAEDNGCPDGIDAFDYAEGALEALEKALKEWARKYVKCNWWETVGEPEQVGVTEAESGA